jgi:thymidylate kinase
MGHSPISLRFIHFFGPDGAGKSTQVKTLTKILRQRGIPAHKYWVRSPHTVAFLMWKFFIKIGLYREIINPFGPPGKLPAVDRSKILSWFWSKLEFLSVLPMIAWADYLLFKKKTLIAERYLLDTVTTVAYFLNDLNFIKSPTAQFLLRFIPSDTIFIFLDSNYETIYQRRSPLATKPRRQRNQRGYGAIPRCPVEPRSFIEFQRKAYKILAKSFNPLIIDTSINSIEETTVLILQYLKLL